MAQAIAGKQLPFLWEGKDRKGNRIKGRGLAKDEAELRIDLRRQGIAVAKVRKERHLLKSDGKVKAEDIALFSRQLSTMLPSGAVFKPSRCLQYLQITLTRRCTSTSPCEGED